MQHVPTYILPKGRTDVLSDENMLTLGEAESIENVDHVDLQFGEMEINSRNFVQKVGAYFNTMSLI